MAELVIPKGWLLFWSTAKLFVRIDGDTIKKLASTLLEVGYDEPELWAIELESDLRCEEGVPLLNELLLNFGVPIIAHDEACVEIARFQVREQIAQGHSLANAASSIPAPCVIDDAGNYDGLWTLKCMGNSIYDAESWNQNPLTFLGQPGESNQEIVRKVDEFERQVNELAVRASKFKDAELRFMRQVAMACSKSHDVFQFWFNPLQPPREYKSALEL